LATSTYHPSPSSEVSCSKVFLAESGDEQPEVLSESTEIPHSFQL
jgi:hypothetical protein